MAGNLNLIKTRAGGKIGVKDCSSIVQGAVVWVGAKSFASRSIVFLYSDLYLVAFFL
jgi:hypothetical protein